MQVANPLPVGGQAQEHGRFDPHGDRRDAPIREARDEPQVGETGGGSENHIKLEQRGPASVGQSEVGQAHPHEDSRHREGQQAHRSCRTRLAENGGELRREHQHDQQHSAGREHHHVERALEHTPQAHAVLAGETRQHGEQDRREQRRQRDRDLVHLQRDTVDPDVLRGALQREQKRADLGPEQAHDQDAGDDRRLAQDFAHQLPVELRSETLEPLRHEPGVEEIRGVCDHERNRNAAQASATIGDHEDPHERADAGPDLTENRQLHAQVHAKD